uniref:HEPN AbiJ-N-terminal domain-containing protein n=2 Tax=Desulfobacterium TaxID=2295 RepID=E1YEB7_9BACT|nr:hypothetical protein N47_B20220 [uncultured Desulfobacterium sp.]
MGNKKMEYFSDKESKSKPQAVDSVTPAAWGGIVALIQSMVTTGAFGQQYPEMCPDGDGPTGTDEQSFILALKAEVPDVEWPLKTEEGNNWEKEAWAPETMAALDLIQFCYQAVAKPIQGVYHSFFRHHHLSFDEEAGKDSFLERINTIFRRNGIAYVLEHDGSIKRIIPVQFQSFISTHIRTGDSVLDNMIDDAQKKFLNPDIKIRKEAIERLWDCWERIKTVEDPRNKKKSISILLDKVSNDSDTRSMLEEEARKLTDIGNTFHIRHSEVTQIVISDNSIIDYLFYRLCAFIQMLLSSR